MPLLLTDSTFMVLSLYILIIPVCYKHLKAVTLLSASIRGYYTLRYDLICHQEKGLSCAADRSDGCRECISSHLQTFHREIFYFQISLCDSQFYCFTFCQYTLFIYIQ